MTPDAFPPCCLVACHRVSTARQGRSGLGLAVQEQAVKALAKGGGAVNVASFTEVDGGKRDDRRALVDPKGWGEATPPAVLRKTTSENAVARARSPVCIASHGACGGLAITLAFRII